MTIELGNSIKLTGFKEIDPGSMVILKKMIGNFVRHATDSYEGFEQLHMTLKEVHASEDGKSKKFQIAAKVLLGGKDYHSEVTGLNIFVTVDDVLKKIEHQMGDK